MTKVVRSIKDYPDVPVGTLFTWQEDIQAYVYETDEKSISYTEEDIKKRKDFFQEEDDLDEFDDNPIMLQLAETKDFIDYCPMSVVAEIFNYINEKRLDFMEFHEMRMIKHQEIFGSNEEGNNE